jgi:hypothetical protein
MGNRGLPPLMEYFSEMNYPAASSGGVSDFSAKNLSFDRKWFVQWGLLPFFFIGTVFNRPKGRGIKPHGEYMPTSIYSALP